MYHFFLIDLGLYADKYISAGACVAVPDVLWLDWWRMVKMCETMEQIMDVKSSVGLFGIFVDGLWVIYGGWKVERFGRDGIWVSVRRGAWVFVPTISCVCSVFVGVCMRKDCDGFDIWMVIVLLVW